MPWKFEAATDIGSRTEQQDRLAIVHSKDGHRHLIVVADGMGGLKNGAQAAQTLIDIATQRFLAHHEGNPQVFLKDICLDAHEAINCLPGTAEFPTGTTALLLYIDKQTARWAHVGDSRLYHFRQGQLLTHTNDHSLRQLMLDKGMVKDGSPAAKAIQNQLYMRLGGDQPPEPDFNSAEIADGDLFLLCSDGFWQAIQVDEMISALERLPADQDGPQTLVDLARQRSGERCDNISLAIAKYQGAVSHGGWQRLVKLWRKWF